MRCRRRRETRAAARLTEWDKQKTACDKETDLGKQKTALGSWTAMPANMTDASKITDDAKKQAALKPVNDAAPDAKLTALGTRRRPPPSRRFPTEK